MAEEKKGMSPEDRQAWLDMAGPDFLPWLQHEVGINLAKLGVKDFMDETRKQIADLAAVAAVNTGAINTLAETARANTALQAQVVDLLRKLADRGSTSGPVEVTVQPPIIHEPPKVPEVELKIDPKIRPILDYITEHGRATQTELAYKLKLSKTSVSTFAGMLELLGLITHDRESTPSGGSTFVYRLPRTASLDSGGYVPKEGTRAELIQAYLKLHPWSTADEVLAGVRWDGFPPDRNSLAAAMTTESVRDHLVISRADGAKRYAVRGEKSAAPTIQVEEPEPTPPATVPVTVRGAQLPGNRSLSLHGQMVVRALEGHGHLTVAQIVERILRIGHIVQRNSIHSICDRLVADRILVRSKVEGSGVHTYAIRA